MSRAGDHDEFWLRSLKIGMVSLDAQLVKCKRLLDPTFIAKC